MILVTTVIYGGGDMLLYKEWGARLASPNVIGAASYSDLVGGLLHQPVDVPFAGTSTGTMLSLCALLQRLFGESLWGLALFLSIAAGLGQCLAYRALSPLLPHKKERYTLALFLLLTPSLVFWTSGIHKESLAAFGLGLLLSGLLPRRGGVSAASVFRAGAGAILVGISKAYLLLPMSAAVGV